MSIELTIKALTEALTTHAEAMQKFAAAMVNQNSATPAVEQTKAAPVAKAETVTNDEVEGQEVYWEDTESDVYGKCTRAEYKKMVKNEGDKFKLIDPSEYKAKVAAAKKAQQEKAAKIEADKKAAAAAAAAEKKAAEKVVAAESDFPSEETIKSTMQRFLDIQDVQERDRRRNWTIAALQRMGAKRATEVLPERRAEFLDWVERSMDGNLFNVEGPMEGGEDDVI